MANAVRECQCADCRASRAHPNWELHHQMKVFLSRLDEQQRRWSVALGSKKIGHGGDSLLSAISGLDVETIRRGRRELDGELAERPTEQTRLPGGRAASRRKKDLALVERLKALVEGETAGDPMSERKWRRRSLRALSQALGQTVSHTTVGRLLKDLDYSLKANVKRLTGQPPPDRETQFAYIEQQKQAFREAGLPIISLDTQKKELIGPFKNPGRRWCQTAEAVNAHDFEQDALGQAAPYGVYDVTNNRGYVYVGCSADTPQFAVEQIAAWWRAFGCQDFPGAKRLLILGDAGGSNGYRARLWKQPLQALVADRLGLEVTVCHYPTGASKWNPIEHRLFGPMSVNWAAQPLVTFDKMLALIRSTMTETGLKVEAFLVEKVYATGLKVTDAVMKGLNLVHHPVCPKWNYPIRPGSIRTVPL